MRQRSLFDELDPAEGQAASTDGEPTSDAAETPTATTPAAQPDTADPEAGDADAADSEADEPEADAPEADEPSRNGQATVRYAASDFWERYQQLRDATDGSADGSEEQPATRITLRRLADQ